MNPEVASARSYLDFAGLAKLKGDSRSAEGEPQALREGARQFEAQFIHMMIKSMREAIVRDESQGSQAEDLYQDMMDREVAVQMAKKGGLGVADVLERQLAQRAAPPGEPTHGAPLPLKPAAPQLPLAAPPSTLPSTEQVLRGRQAGFLPLPAATPAPMKVERP